MYISRKNIVDFSINDYLGKKLNCECGRVHSVDIEKIIIEKGAIKKIPQVLRDFNYKKIFIIADQNTYKAAGKDVEALIKDSGFDYKKLVFEREYDLIPDEKAIAEIVINIERGTDVILAVGSGVLNDLAKYTGYKLEIPYIIAATAPSMDGYASDTSALTIENLKTSLNASTAKAIIGDIDVLRDAPMDMILAGLGDMLGKYTALRDWKLANTVINEYYCSTVAGMVEMALEKCVDSIDALKQRDDTAIKSIMEGLILTGIAMSFVGNSRPASGSEHHISHFFEMMFLSAGKHGVLHGTKVGITSLAANKIGELLVSYDIDFEKLLSKQFVFDEKKWEENISCVYGKAAPGILKLCSKLNRNSLEEREKRLMSVKANWDSVKAVLTSGPSTTEVENYLGKAGALTNPKNIGIDDEMVVNSIIYAKEVRPRYTVLQMLWDMDLLNEFAYHIRDYYFKEQVTNG